MNCSKTVLVSVLSLNVNEVLAIILVSWASFATKDEPEFSHGLLVSQYQEPSCGLKEKNP